MTIRQADTQLPGEGKGAGVADPIVEVVGVRKAFGGVHALRGVDLQLSRGEITGLIGPNGAGKSSLFNVMTGMLKPDAGILRRNGEEIYYGSLEEAARAGTGRTFQTPRGFPSMTALENLMMVPHVRGERLTGALIGGREQSRQARKRAEEVLEVLGLDGSRDAMYDELSGGELRLLEMGRHMMRDIELLLLDEPTAGVIPKMQDRIANSVRDLAASGITVLVVEHNLGFVFGVASTVAVMVSGAVIFVGSPEEVQRHPAVIDAYLGAGGRDGA